MKKETCTIAKRLWSLLLFCMLALQITAQQTSTITGLVLDASGEPIIGASVLVKGTSNGSITDLDGKFTLSNVPTNGTISVSYIGYTTQEISIKGQKNFSVNCSKTRKHSMRSLWWDMACNANRT